MLPGCTALTHAATWLSLCGVLKNLTISFVAEIQESASGNKYFDSNPVSLEGLIPIQCYWKLHAQDFVWHRTNAWTYPGSPTKLFLLVPTVLLYSRIMQAASGGRSMGG